MSKGDITLSKSLSWLLRHHVHDKGLDMNDEGYVPLSQVLALNEFKNYTTEDVKRVVDNNDKKRYTMIEKDSVFYIRANQGHSKNVGLDISDNKALKLVNIGKQTRAFHGTSHNAWNSIKKTGLSPMDRKHVHMAKNTNTSSGLRKYSEVILEIDLVSATANGVKFYESDNGVILTKDNINPKYIKQI
jgi:2'-phosphotransferase